MPACVCCLILGCLAVLLVHELGHLLTARWCGIPVVRFQVGLGPELLGVTDKSGTRWALGALPLGAFVRMPDDREADERASLWRMAAICIAGPSANLLFAGMIYGLSLAILGKAGLLSISEFDPPAIIASLLSGTSIMVALSSLVPVPPLDGWLLALIGFEALTKKRLPERLHRSVLTAGLTANGGLMAVAAFAVTWQ